MNKHFTLIIDAYRHDRRVPDHEVEIEVDGAFVAWLLELQTLVPALNAFTVRRDMVIDQVRARLLRAIWREKGGREIQVSASNVVIGSEGIFVCTAKNEARGQRFFAMQVALRMLEQHLETSSPHAVLRIQSARVPI